MNSASPSPASSDNHDNPVRAVTLIAFAISIFSIQDVIVRYLGDVYPITQLLIIRAIVVIALTVLFLGMRGKLWMLKSQRPFLLFVRAILIFISFLLYYLALVSIPMAAAVTIYYVAPLILTGLAAVFASEVVGVRRWTAVVIGLLGVIVIMRPGAESIDPAALLALALALAGAFVYAVFNLLTRQMAKTENAWALAFSSNLIGYFVIAGLVGLIFGSGHFANESHPALGFMTRAWIVPSWTDLGLIATTGVIATAGFYCLAEGYRTAPSSLAAPFEYLIIPWSAFWGFLLWSEVPHWMTGIGILMILGSGFYIIYRERKVGDRILTSRSTRMRP